MQACPTTGSTVTWVRAWLPAEEQVLGQLQLLATTTTSASAPLSPDKHLLSVTPEAQEDRHQCGQEVPVEGCLATTLQEMPSRQSCSAYM